MTDQKVVKSR